MHGCGSISWLLLFYLEINFQGAYGKAMPKPIALYNFTLPYGYEDMSGNGLPQVNLGRNIRMAEGPWGNQDGAFQFIGHEHSWADIPKSYHADTRYSITALLWVRQETSGPILLYDKYSLKGVNFWFRTSTELYLQIPERGTGTKYGASTYSNLTTNTWHHVGFTYDYSTGLQRLYVNGTMVAERNIGTHEIATNYEIRFGKSYGIRLTSTSEFMWKGRMHCFQLYDTALTQVEVKTARDMCTRKELLKMCSSYKILKNFTEAKSHTWYKFNGKKAKKIKTTCPATSDCHVWIRGSHPARALESVEHELCLRGASGCEQKAKVEIRQCYGFYVYKFKGLPARDANLKICLATDSDIVAPDTLFEQIPGHCLTDHVYHTETEVPSPHECIDYCLVDDKRCKSVNYSARENGMCQLNNATATEFDRHLAINQTWEYYQPSQAIFVI
ncbi:uncharacterized protein LOC116611884 [Nematostella vectensis]|uniref:uncharacterized protein LOC116611884 n=1 Tax=Nematostella vectensis TaxID=45351 RepID=UPI0013906507|nr:uncharacterized protein LOC116611884 [Nematostella vectensis]